MCCWHSRVLFEFYGAHQDLHVLTHSFPTRRSADLGRARGIVIRLEDDPLGAFRDRFLDEEEQPPHRDIAPFWIGTEGPGAEHSDPGPSEIGGAHVCTPVTNAHHV